MADPVEPPKPNEKVVDLMAALEKSVAAAKEARARHPQPGSAAASPPSTDPAVVNESVASFSARENAKAQVPSTNPPSDERCPDPNCRNGGDMRTASHDASSEFYGVPTEACMTCGGSGRAVPSLPVPDPPDDEAFYPSVDVCAWCGDSECDGIGCIAALDPDDTSDHEAIERLHDWLRRGRFAAAAGAVVVFGDGLNNGDRLRLTDHQGEDQWRRVLTDKEPQQEPTRCTYTFPLPSWMGADQDDPCRCDLPHGHEGGHSCEHLRADKEPTDD